MVEDFRLTWRAPRNRTLADVVTAGCTALRLASFEASARLALLVGCEDRLAAEFDSIRLSLGSGQCAPRCGGVPASPQRQGLQRRSRQSRMSYRGRLGERTDAGTGLAGNHQRSVVSRERRSTAEVITTSPGESRFIGLRSCGRSADVPALWSLGRRCDGCWPCRFSVWPSGRCSLISTKATRCG